MLIIMFVLAALNPFGGVAISIPLAMFQLAWPAWLAVLLSVPLAYVQVIVVDVFWEQLMRWPAWRRLMERRQSPRLTALFAHRRARLLVAIFGVFLGPWAVAGLSRFAGHQRRFAALPLLFGISYVSVAIAVGASFAPGLLPVSFRPATASNP